MMPRRRQDPRNENRSPKKKLTQTLLTMGETTGLSVTEDLLELRREQLPERAQGTDDRDGV